jgi:hypothetical protein
MKEQNVSIIFINVDACPPDACAFTPPCMLNRTAHIEYKVICIASLALMKEHLSTFNDLFEQTTKQVKMMYNVSMDLFWYPKQLINDLDTLQELESKLHRCTVLYFGNEWCGFNHHTQFIRSFISICDDDYFDTQLISLNACAKVSGIHVILTNLKLAVGQLSFDQIINLSCSLKHDNIVHFDVDQFHPNIQYIINITYTSVDANQ